jgi:hypothetical protein
MTITVCLLTRNHADSLSHALKSVAAVADELLVADTGSTDLTTTIARENNARVLALPFNDDFASALNSALDAATGTWVLQLNPDEELDPATAPTLKAAVAVPTALAYYVQVRQELRADRPGHGTTGWEPRLFRRDPAVRYRGRLHPKFHPSLEALSIDRGLGVTAADVLLRRRAYLSVQTPDKLRFTLRLLEAELRDRPGQLPFLIEYGRHLLWLNDPRGHDVLAEAAAQVHPVTNEATPPHPMVGQLLEYLLTVSPEQSRSAITRDEARGVVTRWFPKTPPVLWTAAGERFAAGDFAAAAELLGRLVALGRAGDADTSGGGFDPDLVGAAALLNLTVCYIRLGNWAAARTTVAPLLTDPVHGERAARLFAEADRHLRAEG